MKHTVSKSEHGILQILIKISKSEKFAEEFLRIWLLKMTVALKKTLIEKALVGEK